MLAMVILANGAGYATRKRRRATISRIKTSELAARSQGLGLRFYTHSLQRLRRGCAAGLALFSTTPARTLHRSQRLRRRMCGRACLFQTTPARTFIVRNGFAAGCAAGLALFQTTQPAPSSCATASPPDVRQGLPCFKQQHRPAPHRTQRLRRRMCGGACPPKAVS